MSHKREEEERLQSQPFTPTREQPAIKTDGNGNIVEDDDAKFERQMKAARDRMENYKEVLAKLAKS